METTIIRSTDFLRRESIDRFISKGYWRSIYEGKFCLRNKTTILMPKQLPFKVVTFQSKANEL